MIKTAFLSRSQNAVHVGSVSLLGQCNSRQTKYETVYKLNAGSSEKKKTSCLVLVSVCQSVENVGPQNKSSWKESRQRHVWPEKGPERDSSSLGLCHRVDDTLCDSSLVCESMGDRVGARACLDCIYGRSTCSADIWRVRV